MVHTRKTAIVTGAASGIGQAIALALADAKYNLALIDNDSEELKKVTDACNKKSVSALPYTVDLRDRSQIDDCQKKIISEFSIINVLVNNAGIFRPGLLDIQENDLNDMIDIHLRATYRLTQLIAPKMKEQQSGYIFNMASQSGKRARPKLGAYAVSKYALVGFNEALYEEMMQNHVKVTALCPSVVDSKLIKNNHLEQVAESEKIPTSDIANTIIFLLNLDRNTYIKEICFDCRGAFLKKNQT